MTEHRDHRPSFSGNDSDDLARYKRVSLLAVAAIVLGVLSVAGLASSFMWWAPLLSIAAAIAALTVISKQPDLLMGRKAAVIGLCLGVLFGSWAVASHYARNHYLFRDARPHCEQWLRLVLDGRLHEAHQLQMDQSQRKAPNVDLAKLYEDDENMAEAFEGFSEEDLIQKLIEFSPSAVIRFVSNDAVYGEYKFGSQTDTIVQTYAVDGEQDGQALSLLVVVQIKRSRVADTGEIRWQLLSADPPSSS